MNKQEMDQKIDVEMQGIKDSLLYASKRCDNLIELYTYGSQDVKADEIAALQYSIVELIDLLGRVK